MSDLAQKRPLARSLNEFAQRKALDQIQVLGKALPASVTAVDGSIVTVKFDLKSAFTLPNVTIPAMMWQWVRVPIQVGDKGLVVPADASLGATSGLGGGGADLSLSANLSALVWIPVARKDWAAAGDPNAVVIYGPNGVVLRDAGSACKMVLTPDGIVATLPAGKALRVNGILEVNGEARLGGALKALDGATYAGGLETTSDVVAGAGTGDQVNLQTHRHPGVQAGAAQTGAPVPGS